MNRRNAIGNIVVLSLGSMVLPSCDQRDEAIFKIKNLPLTGNEEKLMSQLADAIIPTTAFIGASGVKAHEFTLKMVDDCYDPDQQNKYLTGLKEFDKLAKGKYGSSFTSIASPQKLEWLSSLEKKKDIPEEALFFYETTKKHTLQAFTSSKEYMTDVLKYKMVPGSNFKGCVPVKKG